MNNTLERPYIQRNSHGQFKKHLFTPHDKQSLVIGLITIWLVLWVGIFVGTFWK